MSKGIENLLIGAIINNPDLLDDTLPWIYPSAFSRSNRVVIQTITDLFLEKIPVAAETIIAKIDPEHEIEPEYIHRLAGITVNNGDVPKLAEDIFNQYLKSETRRLSEETIDAVSTDDVYQVLTQQAVNVNRLLSLSPGKDTSAERVIESATSELLTGANLIRYGLKFMNKIAGGSTRKELTAIGGRPGNYKTSFMINIIKDLAPNYNGLVFSREMRNTQLIAKLYVLESDKLLLGDMRNTNPPDEIREEIKRLEPIIKEKYAKVRFYDNIRTFDEAIAEIMRFKPDFFIDDFIQMVEIKGKDSRREQIEDAVRKYKWVANDTNSHGFIVSQLNREIEKRMDLTPTLSDYAESSIIEWLSETCLFIQYPYNIDHEQYPPDRIDVFCRKARYGGVGSYELNLEKDKGLIYV